MIISPDNFLMEGSKYVWTQGRAGWAWKQAFKALAEAIQSGNYTSITIMMGTPGAGKSTWLASNRQEGVIYFDACFATPKARREFMREVGNRLPVDVVYLTTPLEVAKTRNNTRTPDRRIGEEVLERMFANLQANPPKLTEGFRSITTVSTG